MFSMDYVGIILGSVFSMDYIRIWVQKYSYAKITIIMIISIGIINQNIIRYKNNVWYRKCSLQELYSFLEF